MGQNQSFLPPGQNEKKPEKKKYEPPVPSRFGKKKKRPLPYPPKDSNKVIINSLPCHISLNSPFVIKLWAYLRAGGADFTHRQCKDLRESPSGKIPFILYRQELLTDSHFIIKRLISDGILPDYDAALSPEQRAKADLLRHSAEFILYWGMVKLRWQVHWPKTKETYFKSTMPWFIYAIVPDYFIQPAIIKMLHGTGVSRYAPGQYDKIVEETLENLSITLGDNRYILGDKISSLDFALFGQLASAYYGKSLNPEIHDMMIKHKNLVRYTIDMASSYLKEVNE